MTIPDPVLAPFVAGALTLGWLAISNSVEPVDWRTADIGIYLTVAVNTCQTGFWK